MCSYTVHVHGAATLLTFYSSGSRRNPGAVEVDHWGKTHSCGDKEHVLISFTAFRKKSHFNVPSPSSLQLSQLRSN